MRFPVLMLSLSLSALLVSVVLLVSPAFALEPLSDVDLSEFDAQQGVQLTMNLRNNLDSNNNPIGCTGNLNPCRMGLEFSGRDGIWLMLKEYYGYMSFNQMRLESSQLPAANTGYQDADRFRALDGTCLLTGCDPRGLLVVKVSYPNNKAVGEYNDFNLFMNIGRAALEFDSGLTPGFDRDVATGSVLGFRMSDSSALNAQAKSRFDGNAYVFGF